MRIQSLSESIHNFSIHIKTKYNDALETVYSRIKTYYSKLNTDLLPAQSENRFTWFFQKNMLAVCGISALMLPCAVACFYAPLIGLSGMVLLSLAIVLLFYRHVSSLTTQNPTPKALTNYAIHNDEDMNKLKTMNVSLSQITISQPLSPEDWQVVASKIKKEKGRPALIVYHNAPEKRLNSQDVPEYLRDCVASYTLGKEDHFRAIRKNFPYLQQCRFYGNTETLQHIALNGTDTNIQKEPLSWIWIQDDANLDDVSVQFYKNQFENKGLQFTIEHPPKAEDVP